MRTHVQIEATADRAPTVASVGAMAVRRTGPDVLHLISTAATPLGGDDISIDVRVQPRARLRLETVAATLAMPSVPNAPSTMRWRITVAAGATLEVDPLPTVVAANAIHHSQVTMSLASDASVHLRECVQIGRTGEDAGAWHGSLAVDLDTAGEPVELLRHGLNLSKATTDSMTPRIPILLSEFRFPDHRPEVVSMTAAAARLPLERGGSLLTVMASSVSAAMAAARELEVCASATEPAS